ncbi:Hypothetical_protein [Hexamita inflata]|uniref:Hypothetical_protein n=1 Tax=Hexamita inflata TaxID=28002 RepID=A0AA86N6S2_9EUKA|nr:Hypothetical protein HINF_LOCUS1159 [Hexamita inflata]
MEELKNKAIDVGNNMIDQRVSPSYQPAAKEALQTLGNLGKMRDEYKQLGRPIIPSQGTLQPVKKLTGWQKFKAGAGRIWNVIKKPITNIVGKLPFGNQIGKIVEGGQGLLDHFKGKK